MVFTVTVYPHKFAIWYLLLQCILISLLYGIYCYSVFTVFTVTVYPHKFAIWYLLYMVFTVSVSS